MSRPAASLGSLADTLYGVGRKAILESLAHEAKELIDDSGEFRTMLDNLVELGRAFGTGPPPTLMDLFNLVAQIQAFAARLPPRLEDLKSQV